MRSSKHACQLAKTIQLAGTVVHAPCRYSRVGKEMVSVPSWAGCDCFCPNRLLARPPSAISPMPTRALLHTLHIPGTCGQQWLPRRMLSVKILPVLRSFFLQKANGGSPEAGAGDFS